MTVERALMVQPPAAAPASSDPNWPNVSLLLHGDGTNGAQNNTFVDSSSNAFSITRNGNTTQGSYTPYGSLWSKYQATKTDYISIPNNTAIANLTGDFTMECWVNPTDPSTVGTGWGMIDTRTSGGTAASWIFLLWSFSAGFVFNLFYSGASHVGTTRIQPYVWTHIAIVRSGTTVTYYVNGAVDTSYTLSGTLTGGTGTIAIGNTKDYGVGGYGNIGYISNLRLVNGTAVYTSAFTPPTAPLTAVTNTSLLAFQSNRFIDNSTYNATYTISGTPQISPYSPFSTGVAYDPATNGGSGYFDGSGDSLSCTTATTLPVGMNPYTIEAWINPSAMARYGVAGWGVNTNNNCNNFRLDTTALVNYWYANDLSVTVGSLVNGWHHVAAQFDGTTRAIYLDGVRVGFDTPTGHTITVNNNLVIGSTTNNEYFSGYLSNVRISNIARYSGSTYTIPATQFTSDANTIVLVKGTNASIFDNSVQNDLETVGNAQISTTVKKYGTGSLAFDGTGDWLTVADQSPLQMAGGNFTVEGWIYLSATGSAVGIVGKGTSTTGWLVSVNSSNQLVFTDGSSATTGATALSATTWYHFAVVRNGTATGNLKIYLNGTSDATSSGAVTTTYNQTNLLYVGADRTGSSAFNGYIDDLRITKGIARYTANFTPPTAAFPNY